MHFNQIRNSHEFARIYGTIMAFLERSGIQSAGPLSAIYYSRNREKQQTDAAVTVPVSGVSEVTDKEVALFEIGRTKVAKATHVGGYDKLDRLYNKITGHLQAHNLKFSGVVIEEYVTDPKKEPDQAKWVTNVYFLLDDHI